MDGSSVCRSVANSSTSASSIAASRSPAAAVSSDAIATAADWSYSCSYGKRKFPGWTPINYGEWQIYPDRRERRHDVLWRGEATREEVTLEKSTMLGQKKQVADSRGDLPELSPGDKPYQIPEYMPEFHKIGSTRPVVNFGQQSCLRSNTLIPLQMPTDYLKMTTYKAKRAQQLLEDEIEEVRKLCKWRPSSPFKAL